MHHSVLEIAVDCLQYHRLCRIDIACYPRYVLGHHNFALLQNGLPQIGDSSHSVKKVTLLFCLCEEELAVFSEYRILGQEDWIKERQ
jgi:hypothetical protein